MSAYDFGKDAATGITSLGNRIKKDLSEFEEKNLKAAWYLRTLLSMISLVIAFALAYFGGEKLDEANTAFGYAFIALAILAVLFAAVYSWEISVGVIAIFVLMVIYNKTKDFSETQNLIVAAWFSLAWLIYATRK